MFAAVNFQQILHCGCRLKFLLEILTFIFQETLNVSFLLKMSFHRHNQHATSGVSSLHLIYSCYQKFVIRYYICCSLYCDFLLFQNTMRLNGWGAISLGFIGLVFVVTLGKIFYLSDTIPTSDFTRQNQ